MGVVEIFLNVHLIARTIKFCAIVDVATQLLNAVMQVPVVELQRKDVKLMGVQALDKVAQHHQHVKIKDAHVIKTAILAVIVEYPTANALGIVIPLENAESNIVIVDAVYQQTNVQQVNVDPNLLVSVQTLNRCVHVVVD